VFLVAGVSGGSGFSKGCGHNRSVIELSTAISTTRALHFILFSVAGGGSRFSRRYVGPIDLSTAISTTRALHIYIYKYIYIHICCRWRQQIFPRMWAQSSYQMTSAQQELCFFFFVLAGGGSRFSRGCGPHRLVNCHHHN